jgi:hypothetical protein
MFIKDQEDISKIEKRELLTNIVLQDSKFNTTEYQKNIETILMDQFPQRYNLIEQKNKLEYLFISSFYKLLSNDLLLNPIGNGDINQIGNSDYLMTSPIKYKQLWAERISDRIDQINGLQKDFPDLGIYVYQPTEINQTSLFDEANGIVGAGPEYATLFQDLKVPYDSFDINTIDDYKNYFYGSDHHWNNRGSYQGYVDIMNLMGNQKDIIEPVAENCFDDLQFYGTFSSQIGYVTPGCQFCVYKFDLPNYTIEDLDDEMKVQDTNTFFESNPQQSYDYYYTEAYNMGFGYTHIHSDNNGGNLLIIGDSYTRPIMPLFTTTYSDIYVIYPINYKLDTDEDFIYDTFIKENDIEDLIIMYTLDNYYVSDEWGPRYLEFDVHREVE